MVKNPPANAGDAGLIPGWGRSPGEGNDNPLQYSCLGNPMDRGGWRAAVRGVTKTPTRLSTQAHQTHKLHSLGLDVFFASCGVSLALELCQALGSCVPALEVPTGALSPRLLPLGPWGMELWERGRSRPGGTCWLLGLLDAVCRPWAGLETGRRVGGRVRRGDEAVMKSVLCASTASPGKPSVTASHIDCQRQGEGGCSRSIPESQ